MGSEFYTYIWYRQDRTPYYVGKGTGKRGYYSSAHNVHAPKDRSLIEVIHVFGEQSALNLERALIAELGRKDNGTGILRNLTDGGENPPVGRRFMKGEIRVPWNKGKKMSQGFRDKCSRNFKGRPSPTRGVVMSQEQKDKISATLKARSICPSVEARLKGAAKRRKA